MKIVKISKAFIRTIVLALPLLGMGGLLLASCSENEETGEYDNWRERNQLYVDSIAALANDGTDGWSKILGYYLSEETESQNPNTNHYIYVKKLENGTGAQKPMYNDSVRVHYLGRLIPSDSYPQGYVFGKSYGSYVLNEGTDVPTLLSVQQNVPGFVTALMQMVEGDQWKVVIPYYLGYDPDTNTSNSSIPDYSALIFDIKLVRIYKYQIDTNTTWH